MKAHSIRTDNASLPMKLKVREEALKHIDKEKQVSVLDLFAGENILWGYLKNDYYFGIEKEKGKGKNLYADNRKVIPSLDLSKFTVIDCDSYGIPVEQIQLLFDNRTLQKGTVVIYTCIGNEMSMLSRKLVKEFNLAKLYKKSKVLLNKKSQELFYAFLQRRGVKRVYEIEKQDSHFKKKYGFFIV